MGMLDSIKGAFQGAKKKGKQAKDKTKAFAMKKMLKSQMDNLPKEKQEKLEKAIDNNPDLFQKMSKEIRILAQSSRKTKQCVFRCGAPPARGVHSVRTCPESVLYTVLLRKCQHVLLFLNFYPAF
ncbi:MAG: hypothetical protein BRC25_01805 [Parcubacteria group bacterium SW_6_46_9]|nr:MAG: hypothetical protein BRC25_01805 [Parcubacteria group bacterium SW_6_46_9]